MLIHQAELKSILDRELRQTGNIRKTNDVKYLCTKCHHAKPKLEVNLNTGEYHCWVCHFRGSSLYSLLEEVGASENSIKQIQKIYSESGKSIVDWDKIKSKDVLQEKKILQLPMGFKPLMEVDKSSKNWNNIFSYARKRGFNQYEIVRHNMGYVEWGEYENRLIVPSYDANGRVNFFSSRSITDNVNLKYLNSQVPLNSIVGFELFIDFKQPVNLVEGALDAVTVSHNTIPLFGKTISTDVRMRLIEYDTPEVRILLDDDAEREAYILAKKMLNMGRKVKIVKLKGKDPNKIGKLKTLEIIKSTKFLTFSDLITYKMKYKI